MSGAEAAAAAVARLVAARVVESATYRWRVRRRVKKAVPFGFPRGPFRRWLKEVGASTLSQPVEATGPTLALELDKALSADRAWSDDTERQSKAILLVEQTYSAMVALANEADARTLSEDWAKYRHQDLIAGFAEMSPVANRLSRADKAEWMRHQVQGSATSSPRLIRVDVSQLQEFFIALDVKRPEVAPGTAAVVIGPFGAGKSELAESWFLHHVDRFHAQPDSPHPFWLHASELLGQSLDSVISRHLSHATQLAHGVSVVVDGLDEVDPPTAARIVEQAQVLVSANRRCTCLLTCRPGVLPRSDDHIVHEGLERDDAVKLVERVAGRARASWSWDPTLIDAMRRPFFAIAAGLLVAEGERPAGQADLIDRLVRRALEKPTVSSPAVQSTERFRLLIKIAVETTESGNASDGLTFQERQNARTSTLVHERVGGRLEFSLPIFQQWFAARAIVDRLELVDAAVASADAFDRWRWAFAVAGLAATPEQLDDLLERCLRGNPGAGSWILAQISSGHSWFREVSDVIDEATAAPRLLRATRVWIDSIGPLAPSIFPVVSEDQPVTLGVRVSGNRVSTGWSRIESASDRIVELPEHVHPFAPSDGKWIPDRSGSVAEGDEWPWTLVGKRIAGTMLNLLDTHRLLGPSGGIWQLESRYRVARILTGTVSVLFPPIDREVVIATGNRLLASESDASRLEFQGRGGRISGAEVLDLVGWLEEADFDQLRRPVPVPDIHRPAGGSGLIWDFYSDARTQEFCAEVWGLACVAYDEALDTVFSRFGWSMGTRAGGEFGVLGDLTFIDDGFPPGRTASLTTAILPVQIIDEVSRQRADVLSRRMAGRLSHSLPACPRRAGSWSWFATARSPPDQAGAQLAPLSEAGATGARSWTTSLIRVL